MAPYKRSDPTKLARDRSAIARLDAPYLRAVRSRSKARADAQAYEQTGEGSMREAWNHLLEEADERRSVKKFGGPPQVEGAAQTGLTKNNTT